MERNNRARRPSMAGKMSPEPKTLSINGPDPCSVPCSSQGTAAAAGSYMYFNEETFSDLTKEFDCPFGIDGDAIYLRSPLPWEDYGDDGAFFSDIFKMLDENEELNDHAVKCQRSEINNSYKETTVNNDETSRPDASVDPQNFSNSIEVDYNEVTCQPVRFEVTVPKFIVEVPRTDSSGFLKKAILDKVTAMELRTSVPIAYSISSVPAIICSEVNGSLDLVPGCQKVNASKSKKRLVMDVNSLDGSPVPHKAKSSKNEKRRKIEFFSISEVEALVQLVEEHGTGRWAEIKEQAFGRDSKRTRTDLRDKWRSLVKTAKTPVDKRKGEKLPQVLLDKVVAIETRNSQSRDIQK